MTTTNTNNTTPIDLSSFFQTKVQAADFSARLAKVTENIYYTNFNIEKVLMEQFGVVKKDALLSLLRGNNIGVDSTKTIKEFFTKIQETIAGLPVVPITLAFEPKEQTLKILSDWFMINLKKQVLFDISVDRKLIAGAAITYQGKYKDFSIKPKVNEILAKILTNPASVHAVPGPIQKTEDMHVGR